MKRQLSSSEREYLLIVLKKRTKAIELVMKLFRVFGFIQFALCVVGILSGALPLQDIPLLLVACVVIYLVYFKFAGFLARTNQWKDMLDCVLKHTEVVYEVALDHTYETNNGEYGGSVYFMAAVEKDGQMIRCNADSSLEQVESGETIALVCVNENQINMRLYAMAIME